MLNSTRAPTPDLMPGMDEEDGSAARYRDMDDISDSEEAEMEMSSDGEAQDSESEQPRKKQARVDSKTAADGDSVPKWSNPDPYTALPPPDESQRKKKDVVKLIRKARVEAAKDEAAKPEAAADDFISFDFGDEEEKLEEDSDDASEQSIPAGAPTGPRFSHKDHIQGQLPSRNQFEDLPATTPVSSRQNDDESALGSRKRTFDDEIKPEDSAIRPPPFIASFATSKKPPRGKITSEWRENSMVDSTPWFKIDHSLTRDAGFR